MKEVIKLIKQNSEQANTYGKLVALYEVLADVQKRINAYESQLTINDKQK